MTQRMDAELGDGVVAWRERVFPRVTEFAFRAAARRAKPAIVRENNFIDSLSIRGESSLVQLCAERPRVPFSPACHGRFRAPRDPRDCNGRRPRAEDRCSAGEYSGADISHARRPFPGPEGQPEAGLNPVKPELNAIIARPLLQPA